MLGRLPVWSFKRIAMDANSNNIIWAVVWGLVLALCLVSLLWRPAIYILIGIAALFVALFIHDFVKFNK